MTWSYLDPWHKHHACLGFLVLLLVGAWLPGLFLPLVRTPLPYTPMLALSNATGQNTTYTLVDAHSEYSAWRYEEYGDVLRVDSGGGDGEPRNTTSTTIEYLNQHYFSGSTCSYDVYPTVTGYETFGKSDRYKRPLGDSPQALEAPSCGALAALRWSIIALFAMATVWWGFVLVSVRRAIVPAMDEQAINDQLACVQSGDHRPSHDQPADDPDMPPAPAVELPPLSGGREGLDAPLLVAAAAEPPLPAAPRRASDAVDATAAWVIRVETDAVRAAVRRTGQAVLFAATQVAVALVALISMAAFLASTARGEGRRVEYATWILLPTVLVYAVIQVLSGRGLMAQARSIVRRYLEKEGASKRAVLFWPLF